MSSWTYPIDGEIKKFPEPEVNIPTDTHYFTKSKGFYTPSGVLRSVALYIDGLGQYDSVEAMTFFPEMQGWAGMISVYHDRAPASTKVA